MWFLALLVLPFSPLVYSIVFSTIRFLAGIARVAFSVPPRRLEAALDPSSLRHAELERAFRQRLRDFLCSTAFKDVERTMRAASGDVADAAGLRELERRVARAKVVAFLEAGLVEPTAVSRDPARFIVLHEELAALVDESFTYGVSVQLNLFCGSLWAFGSPDHQALVATGEAGTGALVGAFALTELRHGVVSGMFCDTTATYEADTGEFVLHTPTADAVKNWISFGARSASACIVFADLQVGGDSQGIHAFFVPLRDTAGLTIDDMGDKPAINGNDNARLSFASVRVPRTALLSRYSTVRPDGTFASSIDRPRQRFFAIADQLISGRVCIGSAAVVLAKFAVHSTVTYTLAKTQNRGPGVDPVPLFRLQTVREPTVRLVAALYAVAARARQVQAAYVAMIKEEGALKEADDAAMRGSSDPRPLRSSATRPATLSAVNALKFYGTELGVRCATDALTRCGGQSLLSENLLGPLVDTAHSLCIVEGDSKVMAQKCARDVVAARSVPAQLAAAVAATVRVTAASFVAPVDSLGYLAALLDARVARRTASIILSMAGVARADRVKRWTEAALDDALALTAAAFERDSYAALLAEADAAPTPAAANAQRSLAVIFALDSVLRDAAFVAAAGLVPGPCMAELRGALAARAAAIDDESVRTLVAGWDVVDPRHHTAPIVLGQLR